jgi:putative oxidoreductase
MGAHAASDRWTDEPGKARNIILWALQIFLVVVIVPAGGAKLAGAAPMVQMYEKIGAGQWFRYLTGCLEVGCGILVLFPRFAGAAAMILAAVMVGAIVAHLTVLGGNPALPVALLIAASVVAWGRGRGIKALLGK